MTTLQYTEQLAIEYCCSCGIAFAMPTDYQSRRRDDHKSFYCPAGHSQHYTGKTEEQRQRERADRLQRQVEAREADIRLEQRRLANERRSHAATKGQLTKTRKRIANGVCPCCNRSFANLERHMAHIHPGYVTAAQS
ncbi:Uncharacterised protein [Mycobacteroides abscessus subsp. bolletii]|uniref:hypothetical protein n=1 Tax=Mycobacteroides abscessus TaxID=36809 RepID=UPI0009A8B813|nr:hypothetical protein [Mycobacteroides abscessus]SLD50652.1 Uncharacterised protein [Mycobacteroides abscessus subsp. bolletii]